MLEDRMKEDVGKRLIWKGKEIEIINSFSCYEGDFYEYQVVGTDEIHRVNIWRDKNFMKAIPNIVDKA